MSNEPLPTRGNSPTDLVEEESKKIFKGKLSLQEASFTFYRDKYPNIDGLIEFFDSTNGATGYNLFFSLKGTADEAVTYHDCETQFLNYCYQSPEPCFLILVNIPRGKVYWMHISPSFITSELGITDLASFSQKSKRITFRENQVVDNNASELLEICRKHHQDNAGRFTPGVSAPQPASNPTADPKESLAVEGIAKPFKDVEAKFAPIPKDLTEKMLLYHAFVYTFRPFYLDRRNDQRRRGLLDYLKITDSEERYIIESLTNSGLLERVGDLISVTDKQDALSTFSHYLDKGTIDLVEIAKISAI